jgi:hypothetical protein
MSSQSSDIADGMTPEKLPEHIVPSLTTFKKPWHKVRKQFIRRHQWNALTKRRVEGKWRSDLQRPSTCAEQFHSSMHVARPLRCLVIPGDHLLDVRSMWAEISPLDCFIRYLGFNEGHGSDEVGTSVYVANNALTSLGGVVPDSQVLRDRFEAIAAPGSQAYEHLKHYGPYHVVNLDLCGSMFPNTVQSVEPYYTALDCLLKYQFAAQKTIWLLFITTMVEPAVVDEEWMQKLCMPTRHNFIAHGDFAAKIENLLPRAALGNVEGEGKNVNLNGLSKEHLISLFGVALGKWLLRLGHSASPEWTVEMSRSFRYSINEEKGAVMLSLAFEMTPNFAPPVDTTGMSKLETAVKPFPSEMESAVKLAETVASIADVDNTLTNDSVTKTAMREEAADLLESAGYDRAAYLLWVDEGEPTTRD